MRACPTCKTQYPDGVEVCALDGQALVATTEPAPHLDLTTTELAGAATLPGLSEPAATSAPVGPSGALATAAIAMPAPAESRATPSPGNAIPASAPGTAPTSGEAFDSLVGATLAGRYRIIRRIGEGGMGAVYEARHTIIGKRVAVKVLLEKFLTKSDFVARLLQEARLASAIGHEHIVDVTDFGTTDDGRAFVAMEFLDGESLAQLVMREAPLPVERSLRITRQVASALGAAHAKGIVHRDVKPENVYLIQRGDADFVKVVDFGISKAVKQGQGDDTPDYRLTHTGLLLGTPLYMSPEQARGDEDLDHRVDVWAMGVMLYECLTGEVPFRANNYLGIISQVLTHTALPPSKLRPELGIPEAVESVVMHAMEKDRNRRYAHMSDVERDLERLLAGDQNVGAGAAALPNTAPPPSRPSRGRAWVWAAAVAALVGGVAMVLARPEGQLPPATPITPVTPLATTPVSVNGLPAPSARGPTVPAGQTAATPSSPAIPTEAPAPVVAAPAASRPAGGGLSRRANRSGAQPVPPRAKVDRRAPGDTSSPRSSDKLPPKPADPAIRGAVPSRSGEGYPDN